MVRTVRTKSTMTIRRGMAVQAISSLREPKVWRGSGAPARARYRTIPYPTRPATIVKTTAASTRNHVNRSDRAWTWGECGLKGGPMRKSFIILILGAAIAATGQTPKADVTPNQSAAGSLQPNWSTTPDGGALMSWVEPSKEG